jgi:hypothetical protein
MIFITEGKFDVTSVSAQTIDTELDPITQYYNSRVETPNQLYITKGDITIVLNEEETETFIKFIKKNF